MVMGDEMRLRQGGLSRSPAVGVATESALSQSLTTSRPTPASLPAPGKSASTPRSSTRLSLSSAARPTTGRDLGPISLPLPRSARTPRRPRWARRKTRRPPTLRLTFRRTDYSSTKPRRAQSRRAARFSSFGSKFATLAWGSRSRTCALALPPHLFTADLGYRAENRLFSAYVQTEIGRHQGGKGTGLGLSLVRQIVKLSGGRLGVKSRVGEGSTFWVEMPFGVGPQTRKTDNLEPHRRVNSMATEMSTPSEYRFLPSLRRGQSDTPLDKIDEQGGTTAQIQLVPTNYRFASPAPTPVLSSDGQLPSLPSPLPSPALAILQGSGPFLRPDNVAHLSSSSAPPTSSTRSSAAQRLEFADGPLRVLVVDDDVLTRKLMGRMMERLGCEVTTAENGQVALDLLLGPPEREGNSDATRPGAIARDVFTFDVTFLDNQVCIFARFARSVADDRLRADAGVFGATDGCAITCGASRGRTFHLTVALSPSFVLLTLSFFSARHRSHRQRCADRHRGVLRSRSLARPHQTGVGSRLASIPPHRGQAAVGGAVVAGTKIITNSTSAIRTFMTLSSVPPPACPVSSPPHLSSLAFPAP